MRNHPHSDSFSDKIKRLYVMLLVFERKSLFCIRLFNRSLIFVSYLIQWPVSPVCLPVSLCSTPNRCHCASFSDTLFDFSSTFISAHKTFRQYYCLRFVIIVGIVKINRQGPNSETERLSTSQHVPYCHQPNAIHSQAKM